MAFTHIAAGCASAVMASEFLHVQKEQAVIILAGAVFGSMLPDIDHPKSAFGRRVLPLSLPISAIFGHRGITHSLLAVMGMSAAIWYALTRLEWHAGYSVPLVVGLGVGYLSHLAGDWMTNSGVPLLWPSSRRFVSPVRIFTGDAIEYLLAFLIYGWSMYSGLGYLKNA